MVILSIPVLLFFVSVSEQQRFPSTDDYGLAIDNSEGSPKLRRFNDERQRHTEYNEQADSKPINNPCPDRQTTHEDTGYQAVSFRIIPKNPNEWNYITPIPIRNEELRIHAGHLTPQHISHQVKELPSKQQRLQAQSVPIPTIDLTPNEASSNVPAKSTQQFKEADHENGTGNLKLPPNQTNAFLKTNLYPANDPQSKEIPEYVLKDNEAIPSHSESHHSHVHIPIQNKIDTSIKSTDPESPQINTHPLESKKILPISTQGQTTQNDYLSSTKEISPLNIHDNSHVQTTALKSKPEEFTSLTVDNCITNKKKDSLNNLLPYSRRSMSLGSELGNKLNTAGHFNQFRITPSLLPYSPTGSVMPLRSINLLNQKPFQEPSYHLLDPTKGDGISPLKDGRVLMMESSKVCYACSSLNDATCWFPQRSTTVKYCRQGHDKCVTKTYKDASTGKIVIRDCSNACDAHAQGRDKHYGSCAVCKDDLCNSLPVENTAYSITSNQFMFVLVITGLIKCAV